MVDAALLFVGVYWYMLHVAPPPLLPIEIAATILTVAYMVVCCNTRANSARVVQWKITLLIMIIASTTVFSLLDQIVLRYQYQPYSFIHDHPLQIEEGIRHLLSGKNPYTHDYRGTALEQWRREYNPAVDHFISLPFAFIKSIPFFVVWQASSGWYDERFVQLILFAVALYVTYQLFTNPLLKLSAVIVIGINPLFTAHFIEGRTDIVFLTFIVISLFFLKKQHYTPSLIFMALAVTTKQPSWLILPFYLWHLYLNGYLKEQPVRRLLPLIVPIAIIITPFLLWDWRSFYEDTYAYPAGTLPTSYPIKGYGISPLLVQKGIIENYNSYFPFGILQVLLVPLVWWLMRLQKAHNTPGQVVINYAVFLWSFWLLARFFNDNYIGVLAVVCALGALLIVEESYLAPGQSVIRTRERIPA